MKTPLCLSAVLVFLAGCAAAQSGEAVNAPPEPPAEQAPVAHSDTEYVIGPGDTLQVFVWRNPELSVSVPVRPDGRISTPLVEEVVAVGKTPVQLARDVEKVLAEYVRGPKVNIIVTTALSAHNQVKVIGQVRTPQSVAYREGMAVLDAVLAVGGLTEFAAGNRAKLIRKDAQGKETTFKIHLDDIVNSGRMKDNLPLKPGDVLIVPESLF